MKLYPERHIELEAGIAEEEIPESLKVNIFRIAQEALNNIAKHSKAEWVDISLSKNGGEIELVVSDDGVGMNLDLILQTSTARSLGLTSMRERTELTGGSFSIEPLPVKGQPFGPAGQLKLRIDYIEPMEGHEKANRSYAHNFLICLSLHRIFHEILL